MKVISVDGKVLLANGKAVKPPAGGGGSELVLSDIQLPAVTICTDVIENHIVSVATFAPGGIVEDTTPPPAPKYSYNGVVLPEIPADVLEEYPYCWIRNDGANSKYNLIFAATPWYYNGTNLTKGNTSASIPYYSISFSGYESAETWGTAEYSSYEFGLASNRTVLWSNHDIPNGSATATEIYFEGSEPVLAE